MTPPRTMSAPERVQSLDETPLSEPDAEPMKLASSTESSSHPGQWLVSSAGTCGEIETGNW